MGSGKSTIAHGLANYFNWKCIPTIRPETAYLADLFKNPERWAFETQLAFLCNKSIQIMNAIDNHQNTIIDRSIYEDVNVFAKYFYNNQFIDERSYNTYMTLATHFLSNIPEPDLFIYCDCSLNKIKERVKSRDRDFQRLYPQNHLESIKELYDDWLRNAQHHRIYSIDGDKIDWRHPEIVGKIAEEVKDILTKNTLASQQVELFEKFNFPLKEKNINNNLLQAIYSQDQEKTAIRTQFDLKQKNMKATFPSVYIAAPFTTKSEIIATTDKTSSLFNFTPPHGRILKGKYKNMLLGIKKNLSKIGMTCILPHDDVNEWGNKILPASKVVALCSDHVRDCDLFVSILGESNGAHYEFGLAYGLGKPAIIIHCKEITDSFIAEGVKNEVLDNVLVLECLLMKEIPHLILSDSTLNFISKFLPIRKEG